MNDDGCTACAGLCWWISSRVLGVPQRGASFLSIPAHSSPACCARISSFRQRIPLAPCAPAHVSLSSPVVFYSAIARRQHPAPGAGALQALALPASRRLLLGRLIGRHGTALLCSPCFRLLALSGAEGGRSQCVSFVNSCSALLCVCLRGYHTLAIQTVRAGLQVHCPIPLLRRRRAARLLRPSRRLRSRLAPRAFLLYPLFFFGEHYSKLESLSSMCTLTFSPSLSVALVSVHKWVLHTAYSAEQGPGRVRSARLFSPPVG